MFASSRAKQVAALLLAVTGQAARAATTCSLAAGNLAFGSYDVFSAQGLDSSASLVITCSRSGGPQKSMLSIAVGPSASSNSVQNRRMQTPGGPEFLRYNLYRDASRTAVWGNTAGIDTFSQEIAVPNNGSIQFAVPLYGRIPPTQDVRIGTYSDSVTVTVAP